MSKYKSIKQLKKEQGDNFEEYLYKSNIELLEKIDKIKDEITKDKMEQFDDYVIYLLEKYERMLDE